jgi:hypothetical protein
MKHHLKKLFQSVSSKHSILNEQRSRASFIYSLLTSIALAAILFISTHITIIWSLYEVYTNEQRSRSLACSCCEERFTRFTVAVHAPPGQWRSPTSLRPTAVTSAVPRSSSLWIIVNIFSNILFKDFRVHCNWLTTSLNCITFHLCIFPCIFTTRLSTTWNR